MSGHPKHLPADERRAATVETVVKLAAEQNPSDITTTAIAQRMGLTQGALFRHFPTKDSILEAVMAWVAERLLARVDEEDAALLALIENLQRRDLDYMEEAAAIARLINRPLKQLSYAANRVREGDFDASQLDEEAVTSEIREVNIGFNRMAQKLAKLEQDRAVMLAGISHDLRTPLARLRLETEMSVADEVAREHMVADIVQLDATIDKFLDYARPDHVTLTPVNLHGVISSCVYAVQDHRELQITMSVPEDLNVLADEVELARIISNLLENARRYGKTPDAGVTQVDIAAKGREEWVLIKVRDHGTGVPPEQLANLTKPFFRGDSARTAAAGAGLGLSIVDKTVQRMGGIFALANSASGGLVAHVQLQRAHDQPQGTDSQQRLQRPQVKRKLPPRPTAQG